MNKYTFFDDSYWDSPGCSCCEPWYMEAYNSEKTDCNLGTASSREDCYIHAIITELGKNNGHIPQDLLDQLYGASYDTLKAEAKRLKIKVEIIS